MLTTAYTRSWAGGESMPNGIRPRFYMEAVQDPLGTAKEGRPIFRQEERVELFMAGNPYTMPVMKVSDEERRRWPREYEAFRHGIEIAPEGTPLEEWPILNRAMVMELKSLHIHTVEDIAVLSDTGTQRAMGLMGLRSKARAFLDDAAAASLTEQLTKENDDLKIEIATLAQQVKELGELTQRMHGELLGLKNAPNPLASVIPASLDPTQAVSMQQPGVTERPAPQSSLAAFVGEQQHRRRGRPPAQEQE